MAETLDAKTRVDDLLFIAAHLIDILEQENTALTHNKIDVVGDLLEQKIKLSRAYEIRVIGMEQSGQTLAGIEPALIEDLKQQSARLQSLVESNARELKVGIETGKRYMEALADGVKAATRNAGTYGANGTSGYAALGTKAQSSSVAIDENL